MKKQVAPLAFILGAGILGFVFLTVVLTGLALLVRGHVHVVWPLLALLVSGTVVYRACVRHAVTRPFAWVGVFVALLAGSVVYSASTIDPSWDGNSYHKVAIGSLADGWNPVYQDIGTFNKSADNPFKIIGTSGLERTYDTPWVNHYPKGSWMFAAGMYKMTGSIEAGKAMTPLLILSVVLLAFAYLYRRLGRNKAVVVSVLLAFNPITVSQLYSYYVDGLMGGLLILLIIGCTLLVDRDIDMPYGKVLPYATILMATVLALNLKFTGLAYTGIIIACYWLYFALRRDWKTIIKLSVTGIGALVIGLLVVGAPSYMKNMATKGHPLYPLAGKGAVDFIPVEQPAGYERMSYAERFVRANLAPTSQTNHEQSLENGSPKPKTPFTASSGEIALLDNIDLRQGGYGVWFSGILITSAAAAVYVLVRYGRQYRRNLAPFLLPVAAVAVIIMVVNATWWARYLSVLPVLPLIVVIGLYLRRHTVLPAVLVFMIAFNVVLTAVVGHNTQSSFERSSKQGLTHNLPCDSKRPTLVYSSINLDGALYNLRDACSSVQPVTASVFSATPSNERTEVFKGVYALTSR